jgi:hypothetical protein
MLSTLEKQASSEGILMKGVLVRVAAVVAAIVALCRV